MQSEYAIQTANLTKTFKYKNQTSEGVPQNGEKERNIIMVLKPLKWHSIPHVLAGKELN